MRFISGLIVACGLLAICSCSRRDSDEIAKLKAELEAAKSEAVAAKAELTKLKASTNPAGPKEGFTQWEYPGAKRMRETVTGELQTALYTTGDDLAKVLKHYSEKLGRDLSADNFPGGGTGTAGSDQHTQSSTDSFQPHDEKAQKSPPRAVTMHIGVQTTKAYTVTVVISRVNGEAHTHIALIYVGR